MLFGENKVELLREMFMPTGSVEADYPMVAFVLSSSYCEPSVGTNIEELRLLDGDINSLPGRYSNNFFLAKSY